MAEASGAWPTEGNDTKKNVRLQVRASGILFWDGKKLGGGYVVPKQSTDP